LKIVIRLPGFVDEATFLSALSSDAERATVHAAPFYAFVRGKPTSKSLAKRASLCWLAFADRRAATAFAQANAASLVFREPESGKSLGVQFDFALVQRTPPSDAPPFAPLSFAADPDFGVFRDLYNDNQHPLLSTVITSDIAAAVALHANRASLPLATAAIEAAAAAAAAPPPQSALVLELLARSRTKKAGRNKKASKKKK
jgi:hypothetical protein